MRFGATARSMNPSTQSYRYIPRLERIVAGTLTQQNPRKGDAWETVLNIGRTLHWTFMVIDRPLASNQTGNTVYKTIEVVVSADAGLCVFIWSPLSQDKSCRLFLIIKP